MKKFTVTERYLVIKTDHISYHETATEAAMTAGKPQWDTLETNRELWKLSPGDEICIDGHISIIYLSGVEYESGGFNGKEIR